MVAASIFAERPVVSSTEYPAVRCAESEKCAGELPFRSAAADTDLNACAPSIIDGD